MDGSGGNLNTVQQEALVRFRELLVAWNRRFNLTAISDAEGIDKRLIGDSLQLLPAIDDAVAAAIAARRHTGGEYGEGPIRLIDIGSGAGFPGMVIKIARPDLDVTLMDSTGKKVGFLDHVIRELGLSDIRAVHARAEEVAHSAQYRETFDLVTARAVAALPTLVEICMPFLRIGCHGIFPKGAELDEELAMGERAAKLVGARIVDSGLMPARNDGPVTRLIVAVKIEATPNRYPRRAGVPVKSPLGRAAS
jgi:16S rRNA (guanine527-N7)-methyltransferase